MHPELFTIPLVGIDVKTYGFCLMVGFLSAVWMAMRRAERVGASSDTVLDLSFFALLFGVIGARVFYVYHYWQSQFAQARNPLFAALDITKGGLEFLGGLLGATIALIVCLAWKRQSIRLYMDVVAPAAMWGLAIGRVGCFFNGCCFGGPCIDPATHQSAYPWAMTFPFGSPPHWRQWEERAVTVPAELIVSAKGALQPVLLPPTYLTRTEEQRRRPLMRYRDAELALQQAKAAGSDTVDIARLQAMVDSTRTAAEAHRDELKPLLLAQSYPSREAPRRDTLEKTSVSELQRLASANASLPVHPVQLYSAIQALLLSGLLAALFQVRRRHGVVFGTGLVLYPVGRFLLEMIRTDNPHDIAGLTASQFVCVGMFAVGIVYLLVLFNRFPVRSPALANEPVFRRVEKT